MNALMQWLKRNKPATVATVAKRAGTSVNSLQVTAGAYRTKGKLRVTAEYAARLERATDGELKRDVLSPTCKDCPYAARCR